MSYSVSKTQRTLAGRYLAVLALLPLAWLVPHHELITNWRPLVALPLWMLLGHLATSGSYLVTGFSPRGAKGLFIGSLTIYRSRRSGVHLQAALTTAIAEELVFRYAALMALLGWSQSPALSLLATSLVFSVGHVHRRPSLRALPRYLDYFLLGLLLGGVVFVTGSIYPAIILHAMRNYILRCLLVSREEYLGLSGEGGQGP